MKAFLPGIVLASALLAGTALPARSALLGLYRFNDSANLGRDTSGNNNDATNFGAAFNASGFQSGAAEFNGIDSFLQAPIDVGLSALPQLTWGAFVRPSTISPFSTILSADNRGFDRTITIDNRDLAGNPTPTTSFSAFTGSGVLGSGVTPSTSDFTFLAATYDQLTSSLTFFVDDQSFTTTTNFDSLPPLGSESFFDIGANPILGGIEFFAGTIDNVFVFDEVLSTAAITDIRLNGFAAIPEPTTIFGTALGFGLLFKKRKRNR